MPTARRVALLDVNVLIALFVPDHVHHEVAHDWFADQRPHGWATCPITENGFIRVVSQLKTEDGIIRPSQAVEHLAAFCSDRRHHRWQDTISLADSTVFAVAHLPGHRLVTDVYLLGLAHAMNGALATFDRGIPLLAVHGASAATVQVIAPID